MSAGAPLTLPREVGARVLDHAIGELPNEACGLLSGVAAERRVTRFHAARNAARSPLRFDLDPEDLVRIVLGIEGDGEDLVAVFHSHVRSPAVPSGSDVREARYPGALHLIAAMADGGELRAWRILANRCEEVPIRIG